MQKQFVTGRGPCFCMAYERWFLSSSEHFHTKIEFESQLNVRDLFDDYFILEHFRFNSNNEVTKLRKESNSWQRKSKLMNDRSTCMRERKKHSQKTIFKRQRIKPFTLSNPSSSSSFLFLLHAFGKSPGANAILTCWWDFFNKILYTFVSFRRGQEFRSSLSYTKRTPSAA